MKQPIFLFLMIVIACKAQQVSDTQSTERTKLEFHHGTEFDLFPMGEPKVLGSLIVTPIRPGLAAITSESRDITSKTTGSPSKFVHKDKSTVTINSGNVDKSKVGSGNTDKSKDRFKIASDNSEKFRDNSTGDIDKSRVKTKTTSIGWLIIIGLAVLPLIILIWFFAPRIKNLLKPPGF